MSTVDFTKTIWINGSSVGPYLNEIQLNRLEEGIEDCVAWINEHSIDLDIHFTAEERAQLAALVATEAIPPLTFEEILDGLRTVDGGCSGLCADYVDGYHASAFLIKGEDTSDDVNEGTTHLLLTPAERLKLGEIEANATRDQTGSEIKTLYEAETDTNAFTDALKSKVDGIEAEATKDQTGAEIKVLYEAEDDTNVLTDTLLSKLNDIEAEATKDQTGAEIKTLYEAEDDTNALTDTLLSKINGIETSATRDQTGAEIKVLYEAEDDTNAFTDYLKSKLDVIEAAATQDQTGSEIKALYEAEANTNAFTNALKYKIENVEDLATADQTGAEIKELYEAEYDTNAFTNTLLEKLEDIEEGAEVNVQSDWLSESGITAILNKPTMDGITNGTTYVKTHNDYTDTEQSKLAAIEENATRDQTAGEIKSLYESEADTNAYTDTEKSKLAAIESSATADQTGAEIKSLYEAENNTNAFTDTLLSKLNNIAPGAEVNDSASEILTKLLTVDGATSTLDADTLDGYEATAFSLADHEHSEYSESDGINIPELDEALRPDLGDYVVFWSVENEEFYKVKITNLL